MALQLTDEEKQARRQRWQQKARERQASYEADQRAARERKAQAYAVENGSVGTQGAISKQPTTSVQPPSDIGRTDPVGTPPTNPQYTVVESRGIDEEGFSYTERKLVPVAATPTVAAEANVPVREDGPYYDAFGDSYPTAEQASSADRSSAGQAQVARNRTATTPAAANSTTGSPQRNSSSSSGSNRRPITDATGATVNITPDSFLQGLAGSLSNIIQQGLSGLLSNLPGALQDLLSSTGLAGALSGLVEGLSGALSDALGNLTGALSEIGTKLASGLGDAISSIPGVGPVFDQFTAGVGDFVSNVSNAYGALPPGPKAIVDGAIGAVGANLINKIDIPGLPRIDPTTAGVVTGAISFATNPAVQLNTIAQNATAMDKKTFPTTNDPVFANLSSACSRAATEMNNCIQQNSNGTWSFLKVLERDNVENIATVRDGAIVTPTISGFQTARQDAILGTYTTNYPARTEQQQRLKQAVSSYKAEAAKPVSTGSALDAENLADRYTDQIYSNDAAAFSAMRRANQEPLLIKYGIELGSRGLENGTFRLFRT